MSIIAGISKYFRPDTAILSLDREFTYTTGFYLTEQKELMKPTPMEGCLKSDSSCNHFKYTDGHALHHPADAGFC
jgi:hypothetical protein